MPWLPATHTSDSRSSRRTSAAARPVTMHTTARAPPESEAPQRRTGQPGAPPSDRRRWARACRRSRRTAPPARSQRARRAQRECIGPRRTIGQFRTPLLDSAGVMRSLASGMLVPLLLAVAGLSLIIVSQLDLDRPTAVQPAAHPGPTPTPIAQAERSITVRQPQPDAAAHPALDRQGGADPDRHVPDDINIPLHKSDSRATDSSHPRMPPSSCSGSSEPGRGTNTYIFAHAAGRALPPPLERAAGRIGQDHDVGRRRPGLPRHRDPSQRRLPGRSSAEPQLNPGPGDLPLALQIAKDCAEGGLWTSQDSTTSGLRCRPARATTATGASSWSIAEPPRSQPWPRPASPLGSQRPPAHQQRRTACDATPSAMTRRGAARRPPAARPASRAGPPAAGCLRGSTPTNSGWPRAVTSASRRGGSLISAVSSSIRFWPMLVSSASPRLMPSVRVICSMALTRRHRPMRPPPRRRPSPAARPSARSRPRRPPGRASASAGRCRCPSRAPATARRCRPARRRTVVIRSPSSAEMPPPTTAPAAIASVRAVSATADSLARRRSARG